MKKIRILLILFSLPLISYSQQTDVQLRSVDSFASSIKYKGDLSRLTKQLTSCYPNELYKARAIFKWITENIRYDYKYYNKFHYRGKEPKTFKCKDEMQCEARRIAWEIKYIDKMLRKKKAVCQGYAMLFKKMCELAGLKSELVAGYVRTEPYQVGTAGRLDHAWNVVWIDSNYYLVDATWAAGSCTKNEDGLLLSFKKNYNNYYWLTAPENFTRDHFPKESKWTLIPNYTKENFASNPFYLTSEIEKIKLVTPLSGIIRATKGDTIRFKINYKGYIKDLQINTNLFRNPDVWVFDERPGKKKTPRLDSFALKRQQYVQYNLSGDEYEFDYVVTDNSLYFLDVLFDRRRVLRFHIQIDRKGL